MPTPQEEVEIQADASSLTDADLDIEIAFAEWFGSEIHDNASAWQAALLAERNRRTA